MSDQDTQLSKLSTLSEDNRTLGGIFKNEMSDLSIQQSVTLLSDQLPCQPEGYIDPRSSFQL